jgi:ketosteroid isomerase-like protein
MWFDLRFLGEKSMHKFIICTIFLASISITSHLYAATQSNDYLLFERVFNDWTAAFNQKNVSASCGLFARSVTADYQGVPTKTYTSICDGFKKIFQEAKQYQYRYQLHQVYRSGNFAAVRLTWFLSIYENGKQISFTQDEGLDIFEKNKSGQWEIVNYLGYMKRA